MDACAATFTSMEDENELCILEEWDTRKNLNSHLKSELYIPRQTG